MENTLKFIITLEVDASVNKNVAETKKELAEKLKEALNVNNINIKTHLEYLDDKGVVNDYSSYWD